MIKFDCTKCGRNYKVSDQYAGKRIRCKDCSEVNTIPSAPSAKIKEVGSGDSVAAFNNLLEELSQYEKTAPEFDPNATANPV